MPSGRRKAIPTDSLMQLRQRLDRLPKKSPERITQVAAIAELYGVSPSTVYRALNLIHKPHAAHRADHGKPRVLQQAELERYCELIAALKLRTTNKQGRHLSTRRAIELLEGYGVETEQGLVKAPKGVLTFRLRTAMTAGSSTCRPPTSSTSISRTGSIRLGACRR
jgi:transposase-like protein